jgi:hypothetical protein
MAIRLRFKKNGRDLTGRSKMWGCPDLPDSLDYPEVAVNDDGEVVDDPMTFFIQLQLVKHNSGVHCCRTVPFDSVFCKNSLLGTPI